MAVHTSDNQQFDSLADAVAHYAADSKVKIFKDKGRTYIAVYGEIDINDVMHLPYAILPERLIEVQ